MLQERGVPFQYRDYRDQPLSLAELREVCTALDLAPAALLRLRDPAARELGLTGQEPAEEILRLMARHPTLLQRPIGRAAGRAVVGRPPERLLELVARS